MLLSSCLRSLGHEESWPCAAPAAGPHGERWEGAVGSISARALLRVGPGERGWAVAFGGSLGGVFGVVSPAPAWEQPPGASLEVKAAPELLAAPLPCSNRVLSPAGTVGVQLPGLHEYGAVGGSTHAVSAAMWACQHCTFMNQPGTDHCEMCSLPRT